jgi:hypothetical protein
MSIVQGAHGTCCSQPLPYDPLRRARPLQSLSACACTQSLCHACASACVTACVNACVNVRAHVDVCRVLQSLWASALGLGDYYYELGVQARAGAGRVCMHLIDTYGMRVRQAQGHRDGWAQPRSWAPRACLPPLRLACQSAARSALSSLLVHSPALSTLPYFLLPDSPPGGEGLPSPMCLPNDSPVTPLNATTRWWRPAWPAGR